MRIFKSNLQSLVNACLGLMRNHLWYQFGTEKNGLWFDPSLPYRRAKILKEDIEKVLKFDRV